MDLAIAEVIDPPVTLQRSRLMGKVRGKNTEPEKLVRSLAHALGYRFRLHRRDLPGCPDIVFPSLRKVILVHGCFWHQHSGCRKATLPKTRRAFWRAKLFRNKKRDTRNIKALKAMGWGVLVIWECELRDGDPLRRRLGTYLRSTAGFPPRRRR